MRPEIQIGKKTVIHRILLIFRDNGQLKLVRDLLLTPFRLCRCDTVRLRQLTPAGVQRLTTHEEPYDLVLLCDFKLPPTAEQQTLGIIKDVFQRTRVFFVEQETKRQNRTDQYPDASRTRLPAAIHTEPWSAVFSSTEQFRRFVVQTLHLETIDYSHQIIIRDDAKESQTSDNTIHEDPSVRSSAGGIHQPQELVGHDSYREIGEGLPPDAARLVDIICTNPLAKAPERLPRFYVPPTSSNTNDLEAPGDSSIDKDYVSVDSFERFHQFLAKHPNRVTFLLIGHRGSGKSSFLHYYFKHYKPFTDLSNPFVIVNFLHYGFVGDSEDIHRRLAESLYMYYTRTNHTYLIDKYPTKRSLASPHALREVITWLSRVRADFDRAVPFEVLSFLTDRNRLGETDVAMIGDTLLSGRGAEQGTESIQGTESVDTDTFTRAYDEALKRDPWKWLLALYDYVTREAKTKPLYYFAKWLFISAFTSSPFASSDIFQSRMADWYSDKLKNSAASIATLREQEIIDLVSDFAAEVKTRTQKELHVVLDNIDRLTAYYAESRMLHWVVQALHASYDKVRLVIAARQSSREIAEKMLKDSGFQFANASASDAAEPEGQLADVARYFKYYLPPVSLQDVLKARIASLRATESLSKDGRDVLARMAALADVPIKTASLETKTDYTLPKMITGITGNNIETGLVYFGNCIRSKRSHYNFDKRNYGMLRDINGRTCVAEHIVMRPLFLRDQISYEFRRGVSNLFHVPGATDYQGHLVQVRILELALDYRQRCLKDVFSVMRGLGYSPEIVQTAIRQLSGDRLIAVAPSGADIRPDENASIVWRYRGNYYYEHLIHQLSYIQMVYFMMVLPKDYADHLGYPDVPTVRDGKLTTLLNNFLTVLRGDLLLERAAATPAAIMEYEQKRHLDEVFERATGAYIDLHYIFKSMK